MGVYINGVTKQELKEIFGKACILYNSADLVEIKTPHGRLYEETKIIDFAKDMKISASDYATWWYGEDAVIEAEVE